MKGRRSNRKGYGHTDGGQGTGIMIASGIVLVMIVILLCVLIWQIFHQEKSASPAVNQNSQETFSDTLRETVPSSEDGEKQQSGASQSGDGEDGGNDLGVKFEEISDIVTAKEETNLRSEPSTEKGSETVVVLLKNGETVERTGINQELGWSRLEYQDRTVYASTSLLVQGQEEGTEEEGGEGEPEDAEDAVPVELVATQAGKIIAFTVCDDIVMSKIPVNLRTEPSAEQGDATIAFEVEAEQELKRVGYDEVTGWSRVEYQDQLLYVVTRLVKVMEEDKE